MEREERKDVWWCILNNNDVLWCLVCLLYCRKENNALCASDDSHRRLFDGLGCLRGRVLFCYDSRLDDVPSRRFVFESLLLTLAFGTTGGRVSHLAAARAF